MFQLTENSVLTKLTYYTESPSESTILTNHPKTITRKLNARMTIILLFHEMTYTHLHGKRNLVDPYLTFLLYKLILTQLILMKVTHTDQTLSLSRALIFVNQAMVKTGETCPTFDPSVVDPSNPKADGQSREVETAPHLTPMIVPNKRSSQARTLKLHMNLCNNHNRGGVTTLQR